MRASRTFLRLVGVLLAGQGLAATALVAAGTVVAIAARNLSGDARLAGLPGTLETLGAALSAYPAGRLMDRFGRRNGLTGGFALGALGGALGGLALMRGDFFLLLAGYSLFGLSRGVTSLGRFAAAEIATPENRAKAVSWVVLGGTFGAIIGPALVKPSGDMVLGWGASELAGPFVAAVGLYALAGAAMFALLRPDPAQVALRRAPAADLPGALDPDAGRPGRTFAQVLRLRRARLAVAAMMLGYWVMVAVMVVTPLHMDEGHHGLEAISGVIGAHVFGMFAFSLVTGRLADRFGREAVIAAGALVLVAACLLVPLAPTVPVLAAALFLLGLGWNFTYVAGSSLLADVLRPGERGRIQGASDLLVGLSSAAGSLTGGLIFAGAGYRVMALAGTAAALLLLAFTALHRPERSRKAEGRRADMGSVTLD